MSREAWGPSLSMIFQWLSFACCNPHVAKRAVTVDVQAFVLNADSYIVFGGHCPVEFLDAVPGTAFAAC